MVDVPGTPDALTVGEHTGEPQPEAPAPVPATAAPAQDAVTINNHLHKVADDLSLVVDYVKTWLSDHPAAQVVPELESAIRSVKDLVV